MFTICEIDTVHNIRIVNQFHNQAELNSLVENAHINTGRTPTFNATDHSIVNELKDALSFGWCGRIAIWWHSYRGNNNELALMVAKVVRPALISTRSSSELFQVSRVSSLKNSYELARDAERAFFSKDHTIVFGESTFKYRGTPHSSVGRKKLISAFQDEFRIVPNNKIEVSLDGNKVTIKDNLFLNAAFGEARRAILEEELLSQALY